MSKPYFDKILHGGDYNPGQWPPEFWQEDMRIFEKAHINSATINVFSWGRLQPSEKEYNFSELDQVVDLLTERDYEIVMGTSTAALPAWLSRKYPDVNRTDFYGRPHKYGHRHNACPNSLSFQYYAKELVTRIAERYGSHPNVKVWHISNEYSGECYCDNCAKAFRIWLKEKYKTIEAVNEAWNFDFWSHTLYDFEDIVPPNYLGDGVSDTMAAFAGISIDYRRFMSDSLLNNFIMEKEIIRKYDKERPVTTNFMGAYKGLDYFKWAKEMDIVSWDNYPGLNTSWSHVAMNHDLMRGMKNGQSFMLMEQTPSQQNWQPYNSLKPPGRMRVQSYHAIAHGADTIQYFQLRRSKGGCEKFHGAVIEHVGHENTRVFREVAELGKELEQLGNCHIGAETPSKVAILFDWDNYWALEYTSGPHKDLYYVSQIQQYYDAFYRRNIAVDMIPMDADFSAYDVILAPVFYMVKEGMGEKVETFVEEGGTFLTTFMSGIVDQSDNVHLGGYPGPLRKTMGIWVEEIDALPPDESVQIHGESGETYQGEMLADLIHSEGATVFATYASQFYAGIPVVTHNSFGKGTAWYVGTVPNQALLDAIVHQIVLKNNVVGFGIQPDGIEITKRVKGDQEFIFIMNHGEKPVRIEIDLEGYINLLTKESFEKTEELPPYGVKILSKG
ncbi:beta-galactosidase [Jeotgalibaca caeni]|uniref:beta-galactosidase n=1 Tax=Jeotgalibaca caeni TaxID=3028623 RepID=UPI00237DC332|nr:beta-galactosidase [Jeotgalibaca caeni]MDE1549089.1 beta-galactosidase [Jeotgalibaca caeni]